MKISLFLIPLLIAFVRLPLLGDDAPPPYAADELVHLARERRLWRDDYWRLLLQRRRDLFGDRSLIDDERFFLAPGGQDDPRAELEATLRALAAPPQADERHVFDRFPARCEWLVEVLPLDRRRLPVALGEESERFIEHIAPSAALLVFPNASMDTPATFFGHTLIAIRSAKSERFKQAVDYSPDTSLNGFALAFKGIFGLYHGVYSVTPYQRKIADYTDIAMRDIWEYELNLTETEIVRMLRYVWELNTIGSQYFFFDENCSFKLLFLLDVARPGHNLHRKTKPWVTPLDTVKLVQSEGFIRSRNYRPSLATRLRWADDPALETRTPASPDRGHASQRLQLGRARDGGRNITRLGLRMAYHDLTDPAIGYPDGAEIQIVNLNLRLDDGSQRVDFERLDIVRVRSLAAGNATASSLSWEANASVVKDWGRGDRRRTHKHLGGGVGKSWATPANGLLYFLPRGDLRLVDQGRKHSLGGGATAGFRCQPGERLLAGVELYAVRYVAGDRYTDWGGAANASWRLARNLALFGEIGARTVDGASRDHFSLALRAYF